ncbi:uncharacterized protein LOC131334736 isoform X3 [Rhododendron vialii]|uniref:uncharacterized protein LOC131334736 isoform X3 n=1 Tax=Rhododendron vialii TaxID=182163 RepID=UPI00265ED52D|nr:uncharacterized protein LOC131334736 isoform X3 [Rhododendron vialii]
MKRGRRPTVSNTGKGERQVDEINDLQNQNSGRSITDLPSPITFDILLRVSVKGLLISKCVCKTWRNLILDPKFATLYFARGEAYPLIRTLSPTQVSRTLYLFEDCYGIECGPCTCAHSDFLCHGHIKVGINTKLKIPLRDAELLTLNEGDSNVNLDAKGGVKRKRCVKLRPKDHKFNVVNSCKGLICLSNPLQNDPVAVCNPVTDPLFGTMTYMVGGWLRYTHLAQGRGKGLALHLVHPLSNHFHHLLLLTIVTLIRHEMCPLGF